MESIDIFWTGGLDSTYRVIELVLIFKKRVKPYYIIDSSRPSTLHEMKAMENIRLKLRDRDPQLEKLLLPVNLILKADIKKNKEITAWYESLKSRLRIGVQYEWLSRFTYENDLSEIELCIERHPARKESDFFKLLLRNIRGTGHDCRVVNFEDQDLKLFRNCRFPVVHLTKVDIRKKALEYGFRNLLDLTWFCHKPTPDGSICGTCRPCQMVRESGFGNEFGFNSDSLNNRLKLKTKEIARKIYKAIY